jgi:hypothetical protein
MSGVFSLLYEKRTGAAFDHDRLPIKRLLARCPEVGSEVMECSVTTPDTAGGFHVMTTDGQTFSFLLAANNLQRLLDNGASRKVFSSVYRAVTVPVYAKEMFRLVPGFGQPRFYESYQAYARPEGGIAAEEAMSAVDELWQALRPIADLPTRTVDDVLLCPSLLASRLVPMPASLVRYVLMFYVSSLVRYHPSRLDSHDHGRDVWLLSAFVEQAALPLLQSFLSGVSGVTQLYAPSDSRW